LPGIKKAKVSVKSLCVILFIYL